MKLNLPKIILAYHIIITILFVYIFIQFLSMKRSNNVYKFYTDYIMNKYCIIIYMFLTLIIFKYDSFTGILLLIMIIAPFKCALKEFFYSNTIPNSDDPSNEQNKSNLNISSDLLGADNRFKVDNVKVESILGQIKSQIAFDPYKTNLSKDVIYEIYNKYFNNDSFVKLLNTNDDSKKYIAEGNFKYLPENSKVDYDLVTYQNLSQNTQIGINPISDGIKNSTKINRG